MEISCWRKALRLASTLWRRSIDRETHSQIFKVQDYTKADFEIKLATDRQEYISGDEMKLDIDVRYLFGEPIANVPITVTLYTLGEPFYYGRSDIVFERMEYVWFPS